MQAITTVAMKIQIASTVPPPFYLGGYARRYAAASVIRPIHGSAPHHRCGAGSPPLGLSPAGRRGLPTLAGARRSIAADPEWANGPNPSRSPRNHAAYTRNPTGRPASAHCPYPANHAS
jgi:hypothetical protein